MLHAAPSTPHWLKPSSAPAAALQSIEHQTHRKFLDSKLPRGSMLLEVGACRLALQRRTSHTVADARSFCLLTSCWACVLQMVYRHLEAEAGGDDETEANGRARMAEEALLNASVRAHGTHLGAPCLSSVVSAVLSCTWRHHSGTFVAQLCASELCIHDRRRRCQTRC
jgi:hypothetical protein